MQSLSFEPVKPAIVLLCVLLGTACSDNSENQHSNTQQTTLTALPAEEQRGPQTDDAGVAFAEKNDSVEGNSEVDDSYEDMYEEPPAFSTGEENNGAEGSDSAIAGVDDTPELSAGALQTQASTDVPTTKWVAPNEESATSQPLYVVKPGDTLSRIALTHGTTVDTLVNLNSLADKNTLGVGQTLRLQ